jgi:hypothetical protein
MVKVYHDASMMDYYPDDHGIMIDLGTFYPNKIYDGYEFLGRVGQATIYFLSNYRPVTLVTKFTKNNITVKINNTEYTIVRDFLGMIQLHVSGKETGHIINQFIVFKNLLGFMMLFAIIITASIQIWLKTEN